MCPVSKPQKRWVLKNQGHYLGGVALSNTGLRQTAQVHVFNTYYISGAVMFCTKSAAQLVAKCLLAEGLKGWKAEEVES